MKYIKNITLMGLITSFLMLTACHNDQRSMDPEDSNTTNGTAMKRDTAAGDTLNSNSYQDTAEHTKTPDLPKKQ